MFFMFYILIFAVTCFPKIHSVYFNENIERKDEIRNRSSTFTVFRPIFQILENFTATQRTNLKSIIYDKMLYDEIFSVQQVEDEFYSSPGVMDLKISKVPTPTLEVIQKWQAIEPFSKSDNEKYLNQESNKFNRTTTKEIYEYKESQNHINTEFDVIGERNHSSQQKNINKIVGLRSLSKNIPRLEKLCKCMKTNPSTTCSHHCSANSIKAQPYQSDNNRRYNKHECTRIVGTPRPNLIFSTPTVNIAPITYIGMYPSTESPYSLFPSLYVPFQTYVLDKSEYYYSENGDVDNNYKRKKHKHRKKPFPPNIFSELQNFKLEKDYDYVDNVLENNPKKNSKDNPKHESKIKDNGNNLIINLKSDDNILYTGKKSRFVKDIFDDLKAHYIDAVIKDCYCSSCKKYVISPMFLGFCILVTLDVCLINA